MNRFMISLKSCSTAGSSQSSSAQHLSRFSAPNFRIPDLSLGNIGEDLQHGYKLADDSLVSDRETGAASLNIQGSDEVELEDTSTTPASFGSHLVGAQVSIRICPVSK